MRWRQNPQRVAWIILTASFTACCMLAVVLPLSVRQFILHSTRVLPANVTTTNGTVQVKVPGASEPNAVPTRRDVPEGSEIATDNVAQALLVVNSDSSGAEVLARIQLFPDSALRLTLTRSPRYSWSQDPNTLNLVLERGRVRLVTTSNSRPIQVQLDTPQACAYFGDGTLDVAIRGEATQVTALAGSAQVEAAGTQVTAGAGQRVSVAAGRAPGLPVPAEQNYVQNGTFEGELAPAWQEVQEVAPDYQPGTITRETIGHRQVVRFYRKAEDGVPNMVGLTQELDQDVMGHDSVVLQLDLQLLNQSVPGGGLRGSEYPVMVDLYYTDIYGKDLHWFQGFYYPRPPAGQHLGSPQRAERENPDRGLVHLRVTQPGRVAARYAHQRVSNLSPSMREATTMRAWYQAWP